LNDTFKKYIWPSLKLLLPFLLWLFLFRDFISGKATITNDTFSWYGGGVKFFLDNIRSGTYPLWDPYVLWGMFYEVNLRQCGIYNPLMSFIFLLNGLGVSLYHSSVAMLTLYYFFGLVGFYLLLKELIKNHFAAYAGFVMLMFSSAGMTIFNQVTMLLLWVPAVWFFYFLIRLARAWQKQFLFGLTASLVLILTTYLPFYFLTVFLIFLIFFVALYPLRIKQIFLEFIAFAKINKILLSACVLVLAVSLLPPVLTYKSMSSADAVIPTRHFDDASTFSKGAVMAYDELKRGGLSEKMTWRQLFSDQHGISYDNDGFIFVPFFSFLILLISLGAMLRKRSVLLAGWGFVLFLIALANASPVHRFLFEHLFYFKLFRNLYFFTPFVISIYIVFVADCLRVFVEEKYSQRAGKYAAIGMITMAFALFLIFLKYQEGVAESSYLTFWLGYLFFVVHVLGLSKRTQKLWMVGVVVLMMVQPVDIIGAYAGSAREMQNPVIRDGVTQGYNKPSFSFMRPEYPRDQDANLEGLEPTYIFNRHILSMQDSPGFIAYRYSFPTRWSYELSQKISKEDLKGYVKYKFVVYDNTAWLGHGDFDSLREAFRRNQNTAFIASQDSGQKSGMPVKENAPSTKEPLFITGGSDKLSLLGYTVNSLKLKTNFDTEKFLVYNDSFHSGWKAFINGKMVPLYRANYAFKGVWLPKGENIVLFRFIPWSGEWLYFSLFFFFLAFFAFTVFQLCRGGIKT